MTDASPLEILLVEDNPIDAMLVQRAMKSHKIHNRLHHVIDGEQALEFVRQTGEYVDAPQPDLILLDLNLPGISGEEVLAELKSDERLRVLPVVVMTASAAEADIVRSYALQANCYITKPVDLEQFLTVVQSIESFWFSIVRLPSQR